MGEQSTGLGPWRSSSPPSGFSPFPDDLVNRSLGERFLTMAKEHPDRPAVRTDGRSVSYATLADDVLRRAAAVARSFEDQTPAPVAILAAHGDELVAAILAVAVAGHIVVVVDPEAPSDQQRHVLAESGATLLIHDDRCAAAAAEILDAGITVRSFDELREVSVPADWEPPSRGPQDPLMLAFTSGTTGDSKAAVVTHGVLLNLVRGATNALGITSEDTMPMLFPVSLAVAAYPMFLPLLNGGTLATLDLRSVGLAPLPDFFVDEHITLAYMAPTVVRFLVDAVGDRRFPDLRMIALGGELVDAEVVELTRRLFGPELLANGFGTTETGVITLHVIGEGDELEGPAPAGYPVPDVELFILDDHGAPVPTGGSGEVAISSPHVFDGYWGHPELSEQVLSEDPSGRAGWRLYRTGDLGRLDDDGALTVLGRVDTKVKVRGRFVVLGDVEADLHALEEVTAAAVVATSEGGVHQLAAVIVGDGPVDIRALRMQLLNTRESYRVPSRWTVVDALPRLPNGKLDRQGVRDLVELPAATGNTVQRSPEDPIGISRTPTPSVAGIREVRAAWEDVFPGAIIGAEDDFFAIGGDSLTAAQMLIALEHRCGVTVPMGELVNARTPADIAAVVERIRGGSATDQLTTKIQDGDPTRPRLWFVHDLQGSAYRVRHVAEALGSDQEIWSFESPLLDGRPNIDTGLDTFAARYLRALRAAQPEGPYWLAGYSFGGICAYEMARQLRREGEDVAFLGIIDVGPGYRGPGWGDKHPPLRPWFGVAKPPELDASPREKVEHYRDMFRASPASFIRHLTVRTGLAERIDPLRYAADLRKNGRVRPEWRLWYAWEEHWKLAVTAWDRTNPYAGEVDLFWASQTPSADASLGWADLAAELRIHRFIGDHLGVLEERGASALAEILRASLDAAIARRVDDGLPT